MASYQLQQPCRTLEQVQAFYQAQARAISEAMGPYGTHAQRKAWARAIRFIMIIRAERDARGDDVVQEDC